jgi:hypothetical protein
MVDLLVVTPMSEDEFIVEVDNLVWKWSSQDSFTPRVELKRLYHKVCEHAVHEIAEKQRQVDAKLEQERTRT